MGSSVDEVDRTYEEWRSRLVDSSYSEHFRNWLLKEVPAHPVYLEPFAIARYPVTNGEYKEYCDSCRCEPPESLRNRLPDDHPVWGLSHAEATAYAAWRGRVEGLPLRLPTEPEWERAAGGAEGRRYPFGDRFDAACCNSVEAGRGSTTAIDAHAHASSRWGVVDMAGNVEEWTSSGYEPYPGGVAVEDELLLQLGPGYPVLRGGSFLLGGDLARTRRRHGRHPGHLFRVTGMRLAMSGGSG